MLKYVKLGMLKYLMVCRLLVQYAGLESLGIFRTELKPLLLYFTKNLKVINMTQEVQTPVCYTGILMIASSFAKILESCGLIGCSEPRD